MDAARLIAFRRRLADRPGQRWLWAVASGIPWLGLAPLLLHALTRRTVTPALHGLTALAAAGFALGTYAGVGGRGLEPTFTTADGGRGVRAPLAAAILAAGTAIFAFGHKHGQDRAAEEAWKWLELDR